MSPSKHYWLLMSCNAFIDPGLIYAFAKSPWNYSNSLSSAQHTFESHLYSMTAPFPKSSFITFPIKEFMVKKRSIIAPTETFSSFDKTKQQVPVIGCWIVPFVPPTAPCTPVAWQECTSIPLQSLFSPSFPTLHTTFCMTFVKPYYTRSSPYRERRGGTPQAIGSFWVESNASGALNCLKHLPASWTSLPESTHAIFPSIVHQQWNLMPGNPAERYMLPQDLTSTFESNENTF